MGLVDELNRRRKLAGMTYEALSEKSGVPLSTIRKIFGHITESPRYGTLEKLERALPVRTDKALSAEPDERRGILRDDSGKSRIWDEKNGFPEWVREEAIYGTAAISGEGKGPYTVEDYEALPEGSRLELLDGEFCNMAEPAVEHQYCESLLEQQLNDCIRKHGLDCLALHEAPLVPDPEDRKTVLCPDIMVICGRDMVEKGKVTGAPPLVMEILSPSTRGYDFSLKKEKYQNSGVREYWLVDIQHKVICLFDLEHAGEPGVPLYTVYGFGQKVPVGISEGRCSIDFGAISSALEWLKQAGT